MDERIHDFGDSNAAAGVVFVVVTFAVDEEALGGVVFIGVFEVGMAIEGMLLDWAGGGDGRGRGGRGGRVGGGDGGDGREKRGKSGRSGRGGRTGREQEAVREKRGKERFPEGE